MKQVILILTTAALCGAQTISLPSSGAANPGSSILVPLTLQNNGSGIAALEWVMSYPSTDVSSVSVTASDAATSAGKNVLCNPVIGTITCLVSGNNTSILSSGVIASALVQLAPSPADSNVSITLGALGASPAGDAVSINSTGDLIAIAQPSQPPPPPPSNPPPTTGPVVGIQTISAALSGSSNAFSASFSSTVAAGHAIDAILAWKGNPGSAANCTDTLGSSFSVQTGTLDPVNGYGSAIFTASAARTGKEKITCALGSSVSSRSITLMELPQ